MAYSFDPKDDVEEQWRKWQEANPPETFMDIKEDDLREQTIKDLAYVSQMDVKEYTLYQKWCEIHEKYPTVETNTIFGVENQLVDVSQEDIIKSVKDNIWIPETPED